MLDLQPDHFYTESYLLWDSGGRAGFLTKPQKLGGTNTVIGISSALFSVKQFGIEVDFVPGPFRYY